MDEIKMGLVFGVGMRAGVVVGVGSASRVGGRNVRRRCPFNGEAVRSVQHVPIVVVPL